MLPALVSIHSADVVNRDMPRDREKSFLEVSQPQVGKQGRGPHTFNKAFYRMSAALGALMTH